MQGRTVLLVVCQISHQSSILPMKFLQTHNITMASPIADFVVSIGSNGHVLRQGSLSSALEFNKDLSADVDADKREVRLAQELDTETPDVHINNGSGKLIVAEEIAEGHVS
jgi:hypothetical protein